MAASELDQDRSIAQTLRLAWPAFFQTFGRLTDIQRQAIPLIHEGMDVLICSPTASGKTEAVCAPLVERNIRDNSDWTILYVCPTRALVNDLYYRLESPLDRMGVTLVRRTGDHRDFSQDMSKVLLTTPESFDSLMCRGKLPRGTGHSLANVTAVVLDEVHLLGGTPRGEQVRWLLQRLRRLRGQAVAEGWASSDKIQIVALSATIENPEMVVTSFMPGGEIIAVRGQREIEIVGETKDYLPIEKALEPYLRRINRSEKVLVFSNTRRRVDELAHTLGNNLKDINYVVKAHHGSLSKRSREEAEEASRKEKRFVICATSTLEIGVDIGDIDLVVLDGPAPDVSALLQRIGRGNRRSSKTRVMLCSSNRIHNLIQIAMTSAASDGFMGSLGVGNQYAVTIQQIASYVFQAPVRARSRRTIQNLVNSCIPASVGESIMNHLISNGEVVEDRDGIRLGDEWLNKTRTGAIHSNIPEELGAQVVDEFTGKEYAKGVVYRGGKALTIGGQKLEVRRSRGNIIEARGGHDKIDEGQWSYSSRRWVMGAGQAVAVKRWLGIMDADWPVVVHKGRSYVFHFGGGQRRAVIEMLLPHIDMSDGTVKCNEWFIEISYLVSENLFSSIKTGSGMLEIEMASDIDRLEGRLGRPSANKRLPLDVRLAEVKSWLHLEEELKVITEANWVSDIHKDVTDFLLNFLPE